MKRLHSLLDDEFSVYRAPEPAPVPKGKPSVTLVAGVLLLAFAFGYLVF